MADSDPIVMLNVGQLRAVIGELLREQQTESPRLLTTNEIAEALSVSPRSIANMVELQGLPARVLGPRVFRFVWSEVEAWSRARGRNLGALPPTPKRRHPLRSVG